VEAGEDDATAARRPDRAAVVYVEAAVTGAISI
jgi:hypothetical protein